MQRHVSLMQTRERRTHSTVRLPYSLYEGRIPELYADVPAHWHEEFELNLVCGGAGLFLLEGERFPAAPGDVFLIPQNTLHAAYAADGGSLRFEALVFHPALLGADNGDRSAEDCLLPLMRGELRCPRRLAAADPAAAEARLCAGRALQSAQENSARADLLVKSELLRLFYLVCAGAPLGKARAEGADGALIRAALTYMAENYAEPLRIDALAARCNLSRSYFMLCFRRATGMSAMEHLTRLRLRAACEALRGSGDRVSDIAAACGFNNLSNFNRQFKRLVGCSPMAFRRSAQSVPQS